VRWLSRRTVARIPDHGSVAPGPATNYVIGIVIRFPASNPVSQPWIPARKSAIAVLFSRLFFEISPSASTSKGFLIVRTRVTDQRACSNRITRRSNSQEKDGTPLFAWRNVVQIPSPVLAVADRCFETELLRQFVRPTSRNRRKQTTPSFALALLGRHWEVFLKPRVPERGLVGGGFGRLIAVKVDIQPNHDRAAAVDGSKGGYGWPRLVEP